MKNKLFIWILIALPVSGLYAQNIENELKITRIWVNLYSEPYQVVGSLYEVSDSSIIISSALRAKDYVEDNWETVELYVENIKKIRIRKKGSRKAGAVIGATTGFLAGFSIGLATAEDSPFVSFKSEQGVATAIPSAFAGGFLGVIVGSFKKTIRINGESEAFNQNKIRLREYAVVN